MRHEGRQRSGLPLGGDRSDDGWRDADEAFAKAWDDAVDVGTDRLQDEALRRARDGVKRYLYHQGRPVLDAKGKHVHERESSRPDGIGRCSAVRRRGRSRRRHNVEP